MKKIVLAAAAITTLLSMSACNNKQNEEKTSSANTVKLEMYYYKQENQEGLKNLVKAFSDDNPGISIDLLIIPNDADAAMSARAAQGKLPDILQMQSYSRVEEYASKGYLVDLTNDPALSKVVDSAKPSVSYNGKQYAVPMDYAGIGIIYNKSLFDKYGLKAPTTYRELENVCRTLKQNGIIPFAGLLKENWSAGHFITMVHTALLADKNISVDDFIAGMNAGNLSYGVVDTQKLFNVLDFYRNNMNDNATEMAGGEQQQSFAKEEAAMMVQGLWSYVDALKLNANLDAGFIPFPIYNDASLNKFYADVDSTFGISSQSSAEKQEAAKKFLNWLASAKGSQLWVSEYKLTNSFKGGNFASLGVPYDDLMKSVADKGAYPWAFSQYPTQVFEDACKNGAQQYMMKTRSASSVISTIDDQWKESVK